MVLIKRVLIFPPPLPPPPSPLVPRFEFSATQYVESEAGGPFFDVAVVIGNGVILTFPIPVTVQSNGIGSAIR